MRWPGSRHLLASFALVMAGIALPMTTLAADSPLDEQQSLLAAWEAFCDDLKSAGAGIIARSDGSEINTAEGFQYLAMLTGVGIERVQYYQDHRFPVIARTLDGYKKLGLDSSDNTYRTVNFVPGGHYRIRGFRGNSTYLGFQVNAGRSAVANLNDREITFNPNGSFEVYLGPEERGENWIELPADADNMYVREVFLDWGNESPSVLWFERLDGFEQPEPLTIATMKQRLDDIGEFVNFNIEFWEGYVSRSRENRMNAFAVPRSTTSEGGSADNIYSGGYFTIAPDEALIIELVPVDAVFWNVQLGNRWFQSLDYQYRQTSLNSEQAIHDSDGRYRFVIAHEDPGVANWLDTAGHADGVMYFRWNQAKGSPAAPQVTKIPFADLEHSLPANTVRYTLEQRREILQRRQQNVARRFAL
jgi:hypothetical protein